MPPTHDDLRKQQAEINRRLDTGTPTNPARAPNAVTKGRVGTDSRPFSISGLLNAIASGEENDDYQVAKKFTNVLNKSQSMLNTAAGGGVWVPTDWRYFDHDKLTQSTELENEVKFVKSKMAAGAVSGEADKDELRHFLRKEILKSNPGLKALPSFESAFVDAVGGTLVAPPTQGEVIPLIRPNAAAIQAGATTMALPPSGRYVRPRITGAPTVSAVGEGQDLTPSQLPTGQMILTAKKIAGYVVISEESSQYTSGSMDRIVQDELSRSNALQMDAYCFYGIGGDHQPSGLASPAYNVPGGIVNVSTDYSTSTNVRTNGNYLAPEHGDLLPTLIEERSFGIDSVDGGAWVMRPATLSAVRTARADAVSNGDQQGPFLEILHAFAGTFNSDRWCGRRVVKTTNIRGNLTKGTGNNLADAFFGIWRHMIVATYGALQFQSGQFGNQFVQGLKTVRSTMYGDVGLEYPGAFLKYTQLLGNYGKI